jgi:hypothetical protein
MTQQEIADKFFIKTGVRKSKFSTLMAELEGLVGQFWQYFMQSHDQVGHL